MTIAYESFVARRFDLLEGRFHNTVAADDVRLRAVLDSIPLTSGMRLLDLGCGKGRFATHFHGLGARVTGLDASAAMLASAVGVQRVRGSAARLPFADDSFDGTYAIELFEHLPVPTITQVLAEMARVLKPGAPAIIIDKNRAALDAHRPWLPAALVKAIDEYRGLWMYASSDPVREHWFSASAFGRLMSRSFEQISTHYLLRPEEARHAVFRRCPAARLLVAWTGTARP